MSKFLARRVWGVEVWIWICLGFILLFWLKSAWGLLLGATPVAVALKSGAKEMNDRADELFRKVEESKKDDDIVDEEITETGDEAKLRLILNHKEQQDDVDDPYMD